MCCDFDSPEVYEEAKHRARKPHKCCECGREIEPGETYWRAAGVWDGEWASFKTCEHCRVAWDVVNAGNDCACVIHGELDDEAWEYQRESMAIARVLKSMKRQWRRRRGPNAGQLMPVPTCKAEKEAAK